MDKSYELTRKQKQKLNQMFQPSDMFQYFQAQPPVLKVNRLTSQYFHGKVVQGIDALIYMGTLDINPTKKTVEELMDHVKISEEEQKALDLKNKKQQIQKELAYLKQQTSITRTNSEDRLTGENKIVLSKDQHKRVIARLKKDRLERERNHSAIVSKIERKIQESEVEQKTHREQKLQIQLRTRRQIIENNLLKNRRRKQQLQAIQKQSKQKIKSMMNNSFNYQQIQDKYQKTIVLPNLEQKKRKLKQIREYKSFNIDEIKEHQKTYLEQKQLAASRRSEFKEEWHYKPPPKSQRLQVILEEQKLAREEKLEEKKRVVQEKLARQEHFISRLRDHFTPTIDPNKQMEIKQRVQRSRVVKPQPQGDLRQIGLNYLDFARRNRKIKKKTIEDRPQTQRQITNKTNQTIRDTSTKPQSINYLTVKPKDEYYYERKRRKQIQKLKNRGNLPEEERIKQLKIETNKIDQKIQQKERQYKHTKDQKLQQDTLELLLSSIQAKIGIMEVYKQ